MSTIAIDTNIKNLALAQAKKDMLSLSAVARFLFREYAFGNIQIGVTHRLQNNSVLFESELEQAIKDAKNRKNLSPEFKNSDDLLSHLHTLS